MKVSDVTTQYDRKLEEMQGRIEMSQKSGGDIASQQYIGTHSLPFPF